MTNKKENLKELTELLAKQWNNDQGMIKYCLKNSKYVKVGDKFIEVCDSKPTITKTLYYDDEGESPEITIEAFLLYNEKNAPKEWKMEGRLWDGNRSSLIIQPQYSSDKTNFKLCGLTYGEANEIESINVTLEDLEVINNAIREVQEDFKKRLRTYWKRYNKNIVAQGYWANR